MEDTDTSPALKFSYWSNSILYMALDGHNLTFRGRVSWTGSVAKFKNTILIYITPLGSISHECIELYLSNTYELTGG